MRLYAVLRGGPERVLRVDKPGKVNRLHLGD